MYFSSIDPMAPHRIPVRRAQNGAIKDQNRAIHPNNLTDAVKSTTNQTAAPATDETNWHEVALRLQSDPVRNSLNESAVPSIANRVGNVTGGHWSTRQNPSATQRTNIEIATRDLAGLEQDFANLVDGQLMEVEEALAAAGAPWTPGRRVGG